MNQGRPITALHIGSPSAAFPPRPDGNGPGKRIHWILGGLPKGDNLDECKPWFGNIAAAYTIGDAGPLFAELLAPHMPVTRSEMMAEAIKDAIATRKLWDVLTAIASDLIKPFAEELLPRASSRFGLLTESLQVRGAIALGQIERYGISLDQDQVESTKKKLSEEVGKLIERLGQLPEVEGLFKRSKSGSLILTASLKPAMNQLRLCEILEAVAEDLDLEDVPRTEKTKKISCSIKFWGQHSELSPFLSLWVQLEEVAKLCQFFAGLKTARIHPRYSTIVRTGRTSCHGPNIQQLPRVGGFREMIVPSPGGLP